MPATISMSGVGMSVGTASFRLKDVMPTVNKFTISSTDKSSIHLNLSLTETQSALLLDCDKYSSKPRGREGFRNRCTNLKLVDLRIFTTLNARVQDVGKWFCQVGSEMFN